MHANQKQTNNHQKLDHLKIAIGTEHITAGTEEKCKEGLRSPSAETPRDNLDWVKDQVVVHGNMLLLMDWDDTLFPTSFIVDTLNKLDDNGVVAVNEEHVTLLDTLGGLTLKLLSKLIDKYGAENIHIVSNSTHGWIKQSLSFAAHMSKIYKQIEILLTKNEITMESAQTMYAKNKPMKNSTPELWKQLCFASVVNGNKTKARYYHILSIGDQWCDHLSVKQLITSFTKYSPIHHVIKLKMTPNLNDMINEMLYMQTCFDQIFDLITPESVQPMVVDYYREELNYYRNENMH